MAAYMHAIRVDVEHCNELIEEGPHPGRVGRVIPRPTGIVRLDHHKAGGIAQSLHTRMELGRLTVLSAAGNINDQSARSFEAILWDRNIERQVFAFHCGKPGSERLAAYRKGLDRARRRCGQ